jgi:rubrerythrin
MIYHVNRYRCPRCGYKFDDTVENCPLCEKEGYQVEVEAVNQIMT